MSPDQVEQYSDLRLPLKIILHVATLALASADDAMPQTAFLLAAVSHVLKDHVRYTVSQLLDDAKANAAFRTSLYDSHT